MTVPRQEKAAGVDAVLPPRALKISVGAAYSTTALPEPTS